MWVVYKDDACTVGRALTMRAQCRGFESHSVQLIFTVTTPHTCRKENSGVTKELEVKGLQLVWETQKLRETEAKLRHKEQEMARGKKEVSIMKLKLHELQEKMDKGNLKNCIDTLC